MPGSVADIPARVGHYVISLKRLIELEANLDELEVWPEWKKTMLHIQWALADILSEDEMSLENQT